MPPHGAQALLRDPLLHVAVEALAGQVAQAVGANACWQREPSATMSASLNRLRAYS